MTAPTDPPHPQSGETAPELDVPGGRPYAGAQPGWSGPPGAGPGQGVDHRAQQTTSFAYDPPSQQYPPSQQNPAGLPGGAPPSRPGTMVLALVLFFLSALPFLAFGALLLLGATVLGVGTFQDYLPPDQMAALDAQGVGLSALGAAAGILAFIGGVIGILALLFVIFAILSFGGRNWARVLTTVQTVLYFLATVAVFGTAGLAAQDSGFDPASLIGLVPVLLAVVGVILLFGPAANRYFASSRR